MNNIINYLGEKGYGQYIDSLFLGNQSELCQLLKKYVRYLQNEEYNQYNFANYISNLSRVIISFEYINDRDLLCFLKLDKKMPTIVIDVETGSIFIKDIRNLHEYMNSLTVEFRKILEFLDKFTLYLIKSSLSRKQFINFLIDYPMIKFTHTEYFEEGEYLYSKDGIVYDEEGIIFEDWESEDIYDGLRIRQGGGWEEYWKLIGLI